MKTKITRKLLSILLAAALGLSVCLPLSITASAEDSGTAYTEWTSTNALPTAAGSYKLTADVEMTAQHTFSNTITLDLNGHTVTFNAADNDSSTDTAISEANITVTGALTIEDSSSGSSGALVFQSGTNKYYKFGIEIESEGTLTLSSGTIKWDLGTATTGEAMLIRVSNGTFKMNGGTVSMTDDASSPSAHIVLVWGSEGNGGNIEVTGGLMSIKATGKRAVIGIYDQAYGSSKGPTTLINGGSIIAQSASGNATCVLNRTYNEALTILGGTFEAATTSGTAIGVRIAWGNTATISDADITATTSTGNAYALSSTWSDDILKVSGGTYIATASGSGTASAFESSSGSYVISGGHFSSEVLESYCAEGYSPYTEAESTSYYSNGYPYTVAEEAASITIYTSMTLGNSLEMNFLVKKTDVNNDISGYTMTVTKADGTPVTVEFIDGATYSGTATYAALADYYIAKYTGCYAYEYQKELTAVLTKDGEAVGNRTTSISEYLSSVETTYSGKAQGTMATATLTFCAAAVVYYDETTN